MNNKVESSVAVEDSFSVSMQGGEKTKQTLDSRAVSVQPGFDDPNDGGDDVQDVDAAPAGDDEGADQGSPDVELRDLGDFSPERSAEFDAYYKGEDGRFNEALLTAEFDTNKEKGEGGLNPATYAYLETQGFSQDMVKNIEAALDAQRSGPASPNARTAKLVGVAGGDAKNLSSALKWAKDSGTYDAAARRRFNEIANGKDEVAAVEAVELLMARYQRAEGSKRPGVPQRDATNGKAAPGNKTAQGYKSLDEPRTARKAAMANPRRMAEHNARLAASDRTNWYD